MVSIVKVDKPGIKLMDGSDTGPTYLAFARKGNVLLGIKPWGVAEGSKYGVPNTTYFAARLRSAPENGLFAEEDKLKKVVKLQTNPPNLWDAWPGVTWENRSNKRASTTVGVLLRGKFRTDSKELQQALFDELKDGKLSGKLADYLVNLVGTEHLILRKAAIAKWLDAEYAPVVQKITETVAQGAEVASEMGKTIGAFGMQAAILQKVYAGTAKSGQSEDVPDIEPEDPEFNEGDDEDED